MASKRRRKTTLPPVAKLPDCDTSDAPFHPPPDDELRVAEPN